MCLEEAKGWKLGILASGANTEAIVESYPNIEWDLVESTKEGLDRVESGELDGFIDTVDVLELLDRFIWLSRYWNYWSIGFLFVANLTCH